MKNLFHGTDLELSTISAGSYVTKYKKEARKFGYRRAVENHSPRVFIYMLNIEESNLYKDIERDGAFITKTSCSVVKIEEFDTYNVPDKLSKFKMKIGKDRYD